ncbi:MAG: ribose 5-phosphate isomerase A [Candidatus Lokiarchaeota archaeon]|nr:ribose 5-phosphate isomerase A [Candidatus Lokiarchaeota archaeon]
MNNLKRNAAKSVLDILPSSAVIGLGSGSTVAYFAQELGKLVEKGANLTVVPSSYQAYQLALEYDIPLTDLDRAPELELTVDGADEVDDKLNLIKGGGGALLREKVVASASKRLIIIVDESKLVQRLGGNFPVPVEVLPFSLGTVKRKIKSMGIEPVLRIAKKKMGPVVTDNGNFLLDLEFNEPLQNPLEMSITLKMIPGVIETGLFVNMADQVHVGTETGAYVLNESSD